MKSGTQQPTASAPAPSGPQFIETISIKPQGRSTETSITSNTYKPATASGIKASNDLVIRDLQLKYAILLNVPIETTLNHKLLEVVDEWYGTPYRYGGSTKQGIDCSAFISCLVGAVYGLAVPRSCREQYRAAQKVRKIDLTEGDLVFFNTRGSVSHVGLYLGHNKFVHASTSQGVMISDMTDDYFAKRYAGAGRILE